tara:strand:- start:305 stop:457 length:153 start_codon:yes stop_codon:yes gene_type:complete
MEKIKYSVARAAVLLAIVFVGMLIQQSCSHQDTIGSDLDDEFVENLSNYE